MERSGRRLRQLARQLTAPGVAEGSFVERVHSEPEAFTHRGDTLDGAVGELTDSTALMHDGAALRERMEEDGYLFLRGLLDRPTVADARLEVLRRMAAEGFVDDENNPLEAGIYRGDGAMSFLPDVTIDNTPMHAVLRDGPMMDLFDRMLGAESRCFDYTWFRAKSPGTDSTTTPHADSIYMGRGTHDCYTCWTPFSDVTLEMGGIMVLEGSYRSARYGDDGLSEYARQDVDGFCESDAASAAAVAAAKREGRAFSAEEQQTVGEARRQSLAFPETADRLSSAHRAVETGLAGGRWLSSEYRMGDVSRRPLLSHSLPSLF